MEQITSINIRDSISSRSTRLNSLPSTPSLRIHLDLPMESRRHPSIDIHHSLPLNSTVTFKNNKVIMSVSPTATLDPQRAPRFSSVSTSYAQFLKQRDLDKTKKIVSLKSTF